MYDIIFKGFSDSCDKRHAVKLLISKIGKDKAKAFFTKEPVFTNLPLEKATKILEHLSNIGLVCRIQNNPNHEEENSYAPPLLVSVNDDSLTEKELKAYLDREELRGRYFAVSYDYYDSELSEVEYPQFLERLKEYGAGNFLDGQPYVIKNHDGKLFKAFLKLKKLGCVTSLQVIDSIDENCLARKDVQSISESDLHKKTPSSSLSLSPATKRNSKWEQTLQMMGGMLCMLIYFYLMSFGWPYQKLIMVIIGVFTLYYTASHRCTEYTRVFNFSTCSFLLLGLGLLIADIQYHLFVSVALSFFIFIYLNINNSKNWIKSAAISCGYYHLFEFGAFPFYQHQQDPTTDVNILFVFFFVFISIVAFKLREDAKHEHRMEDDPTYAKSYYEEQKIKKAEEKIYNEGKGIGRLEGILAKIVWDQFTKKK